MSVVSTRAVSYLVREASFHLGGKREDFDPLLEFIGDAQFVLLGEASHGTHEFYAIRAELTKRLIKEKGFVAVAVEADWPDAYRVNRYVQGGRDDASAERALAGFQRFPTWMWRNTVVVDFVEWLRRHNESLSEDRPPAGFYGLDLYSLHTSIHAVLRYLEGIDPEAAKRARFRYGCFEDFGEDPQAYGYAASYNLDESCQREAVEQLLELNRRALQRANRDGRAAENEFFFAEQNARLVKNAEEYYRTMFHGQVESWNLRDRHMAEILQALEAHLRRDAKRPKIVLWAHNSHLGDARATQMGRRGEWNVGQLVRERYGASAVLIGFTTYSGTVTAASEWDGPAFKKRVRPALRNSYERLFHECDVSGFYLLLRHGGEVADGLRSARLERAIGVIYRPDSERVSHYFDAFLLEQFDAVIHLDETRAVEPLEPTPRWKSGEQETFPTGL